MKGDRDAALFGGYSAQTFAYFMIYESEGKEGQPIQVRPSAHFHRVQGHRFAHRVYARSLCRESGERFIRVVRDRILKETVYEAYGERFRIKGQKTAGPVRQLASIRLIPDCSGSSSAWSTASSRAPCAISSPMPESSAGCGRASRTGPGKLPPRL